MIRICLTAAVALSALAAPAAFAQTPPAVAAALADAGRPADHRAKDADRKPAEMVAFAGIKAGDRVVDFVPANGYFTRIFAKVVGPTGHVHAYVPEAAANLFNFGADARMLAAAYPNVSADIMPQGVRPAENADLFWTAQNYHDLNNSSPTAAAGLNKLAFASLKPGGHYVIVDHAAAAGSGLRDTKSLHRIDPAAVKAEVIAAGFEFVGESAALANPADDHSKLVFDPAIRGKTDQFVYKFRKPG